MNNVSEKVTTPLSPARGVGGEALEGYSVVCKKPTLMNDNNMHYCPGCSHGVVHKLIAEVIEEMGMEDKQLQGPG